MEDKNKLLFHSSAFNLHPSVLVIQLSRFGDILQSTPLIANLKTKGYKVTLLIDEKNLKLCNDIPVIDEIISFEIGKYINFLKKNDFKNCYYLLKHFIDKLNKKNFNFLINLNHSNINFLISQLVKGANIKKGFKVENNSFISYLYSIIACSRKLNPFNLVDVFNHFIENPEIFKIQVSNKFEKLDDIPEYFIILHLGAGHNLRILDLEIMSKFSKLFLEKYKNYFIFLTGVKSEDWIVKEFMNLFSSEKIINLCGKTSYFQLKYLLKKAKLLISTDTGIMHLASALDCKILALFFASAFPFETGPYTENALILTPNLECYPCNEFSHCNNLKCKKMINENIILNCCDFMLEKKKNTNLDDNVIVYKTFFDEHGIYLKEIFGNKDRLYNIRLKKRKFNV